MRVPRPAIPPDDVARAVELVRGGLSGAEAARRLGYDPYLLRRALARSRMHVSVLRPDAPPGRPRRPGSKVLSGAVTSGRDAPTRARLERLRALVHEWGWPAQSMVDDWAAELGVTPRTVYRHLRALDDLRPPDRA